MNSPNSTANQVAKADIFADLHRPSDPLLLPNPWDVGSAVMLSKLGFKALATTSAGYAYSIGKLDGAVGRDDMIEHIRQLTNATPLPVSADLENGWSDDPKGVAETIQMGWDAGLVGGSIEDATGNPEDPIYDIGLAGERIAAAAQAASALPGKFMLCGRAENFLHGRPDLADTIRRLQAYQEAGADLLYAPGLQSIEQVRSLIAEVDRPVNIIASPRFNLRELADAGAARISLGSAVARAAYGAMLNAAREIQEDGRFDFIKQSPGFAELNALLAPDHAS